MSDEASARRTETGAGLSGARSVAAGILASRLLGFVRERLLAQIFGISAYADVFGAALRAPNILQNLLGEQSLSASFIPVYSRFLDSGDEAAAGRFAGAVFGLLATMAAILVVVGMVFAPQMVAVFTPGFLADAEAVAAGHQSVDRYQLTVRAVRIIFPMTGLLVLSAWALGVLNSHRRFFLAYVAPVLWNLAIISTLAAAAGWWWPRGAADPGERLERILVAACIGAVVGASLQLAVQLPLVLRLNRGLRPSLDRRTPGVAEAGKAFGPLLLGRGVIQLSGYLDLLMASFLLPGAIAALRASQVLALLPISLFAMSIAAAELPELSRRSHGSDGVATGRRLTRTLRQSAFLTVPTACGYLLLGYWIAGGVFRGGAFGRGDAWLVAAVLGSYSLGLLASTSSRLLNNLFYAAGRTEIPARIAAIRVAVAAVVGVTLMLPLDRIPIGAWLPIEGSGLRLGAVGIALGAALGAWVELLSLLAATRRVLDGGVEFPWRAVAGQVAVAVLACSPILLLGSRLESFPAWVGALVAVGVVGVLYLGAAAAIGIPEGRDLLSRVVSRAGRMDE